MHTLLRLPLLLIHFFFFNCPVEGAIYYISHRIRPSRSGSNMIFSVFDFFGCFTLFSFWLFIFARVHCVAFASHTHLAEMIHADAQTILMHPSFTIQCVLLILLLAFLINCIGMVFVRHWPKCMFFPVQTGYVTFDPGFDGHRRT